MILEFIKKHWLAIFLSLCGGLLLVMPVITAIYNIGIDNFRGVYPVMNADSYLYEAILGDVWDGHFATGNAYYAEGKEGFFLNPPLAQIIVSVVGKSFGLSLPLTSFLSDFFLTAILFFLAYFFVYLITASRKASLIFLFLYVLLFYYFDPVVLSHQMGLVFLYFGLILIYHLFYSEGELLLPHILLALIIGALFYIYPYYWTFLLTLYGVNILSRYKIYLSQERLSHVGFFALVLFISVIPYIINMRGAISSGAYEETMMRYGLINTHFPACYFNVFLIALTAIGLYWATKGTRVNNLKFWIVWLGSLLIINWQNVITGVYVQFSSHYYALTAVMCLILLVSVLGGGVVVAMKDRKYYLGACTILFILLSILIYKQFPYFKGWTKMTLPAEEMLELQSKKDVFDWMNKNTKAESVVYSFDEQMNYLLPIYTHNNVYYSGYGGIFLAPDLSVEKRWVRYNIFKDDISEEMIKSEHKGIWTCKFVDRYQNYEVRRRLLGYLGIKLPKIENLSEQDIERVKQEYDFVLKDNIGDRIKDFVVDYILIKNNDLAKYQDKISEVFLGRKCDKIGIDYCIYKI